MSSAAGRYHVRGGPPWPALGRRSDGAVLLPVPPLGCRRRCEIRCHSRGTLVLVTALLVLGGDARSMLAALYFAVIAASALRLSLSLVYVATLGGDGRRSCFFLGYVKYELQLAARATACRGHSR